MPQNLKNGVPFYHKIIEKLYWLLWQENYKLFQINWHLKILSSVGLSIVDNCDYATLEIKKQNKTKQNKKNKQTNKQNKKTNKTKNKTKQNKTKQNKTKQNKTKQTNKQTNTCPLDLS